MRFNLQSVFLFTLVIGISFLYFLLRLQQNDEWKMSRTISNGSQPEKSIPPAIFQRKKLILLWTVVWGDPPYTLFNTCPELGQICEITEDKSRYAQSDAIAFHPLTTMNLPLLPKRASHQRHVLVMWEAPSTQFWYQDSNLRGFFNWTMTYRLDSDIPYTYSYLAPNSSAGMDLDEAMILNKVESVVWFASNCATPSKRERYVENLQKYIPVDIYGSCGSKKCSRISGLVDPITLNTLAPPCEQELINRRYKFYIAFENSVCRDYVTEKFYKRHRFSSVPIVLSRRIVEHILPPNSFIAVDDFPAGPRQLAEYLKFLMANDTEYLKYFEWKTKGYSETKRHPGTGLQWGFCGLCEKLWRVNESDHKIYDRIDQWWAGDGICDQGLVERFISNEKP